MTKRIIQYVIPILFDYCFEEKWKHQINRRNVIQIEDNREMFQRIVQY